MFTKSGHGFIDKEELSSVFSTGYVDMEPGMWEQMVDQADADSEATLEEGGAGRESESSDSGYTDYADLSYGVNPLFSSLGAQDTASQRCQDFVFFKQSQDSGMQTLCCSIPLLQGKWLPLVLLTSH